MKVCMKNRPHTYKYGMCYYVRIFCKIYKEMFFDCDRSTLAQLILNKVQKL